MPTTTNYDFVRNFILHTPYTLKSALACTSQAPYREKLALAAQFLQQRDASSAADTRDDDQLLLWLAARMDAATAATTAGDAAEVFARVTEPDYSKSWMEVLPSELEQLLSVQARAMQSAVCKAGSSRITELLT
jgi:hypothetical protein